MSSATESMAIFCVLNGNLFIICVCDCHSDAVVVQKYDNISTAICFIAEHNYKVKHSTFTG